MPFVTFYIYAIHFKNKYLLKNKCLRHKLGPAHHFNAHQIAPLFHRELTKAGHFLAGIATSQIGIAY